MMPRSSLFNHLLVLTAIMLIVLLAGAARGQTLEVSIGEHEAKAGATVTVPVTLSKADDVGALQADLAYDTNVLSVESVEPGPMIKGAMFDNETKQPGRIALGFATLEGVSGDGAVAQVTFKVQDGAKGATGLKLENVRAWKQADHLEQRVAAAGGKVVIAAGTLPIGLIAAIAGGVVLLLIIVVAMRGRGGQPAPAAAAPAAPAAGGVFCTQCGRANTPTDKFCGGCGAKLS